MCLQIMHRLPSVRRSMSNAFQLPWINCRLCHVIPVLSKVQIQRMMCSESAVYKCSEANNPRLHAGDHCAADEGSVSGTGEAAAGRAGVQSAHR